MKQLDLETEYNFIRGAFAQNSRRGYELLFLKYHKGLCNYAIRFVFSKDVAEDIVAEVFRKIWEKAFFSNVKSSYRFYLYKMVKNEACTYLKTKKAIRVNLGEIQLVEDDLSANPYNITCFKEIRDRLQELVGKLPPQQQRAFILNRFEGKMYAEVSAEMGISIKMTEVHISKALSFIRLGLKGFGYILFC